MICEKCAREICKVTTERMFFEPLRVAELRDYTRCGCGTQLSKPYYVWVRRLEENDDRPTDSPYAPIYAAAGRLKELRKECQDKWPTGEVKAEIDAIDAFLDHVYAGHVVVWIDWKKGCIFYEVGDMFRFREDFGEELK